MEYPYCYSVASVLDHRGCESTGFPGFLDPQKWCWKPKIWLLSVILHPDHSQFQILRQFKWLFLSTIWNVLIIECYILETLPFQVKPGFDFLTFVRSNKNTANGELDGNPGGGKRNMLGFVKVISRDEV